MKHDTFYKREQILRRLSYTLWRSDMELTRLGLALGAILMAALLFWPGQLFTPARQTYALMARMASEEVWGALFLTQGVLMLRALLWGAKGRAIYFGDAILGCLLWTSSTAACFISHFLVGASSQPPAAMSYEVIGALLSWWRLVRYRVPNKGN